MFYYVIVYVIVSLSYVQAIHANPLTFEKTVLVNTIKANKQSQSLHNVLVFRGQENYWNDARVQLKSPLKKEDLTVYQAITHQNQADRSVTETTLLDLLPNPNSNYQGQLRPSHQLVPNLWVIWITESTPWTHPKHIKQYMQLFETLQQHAQPQDFVFLMKGGELPQILARGVSVENWQTQAWEKYFKLRFNSTYKKETKVKAHAKKNRRKNKKRGRKRKNKKETPTKTVSQNQNAHLSPVPRLVTYTSIVQNLWYHLYMIIEQFWKQNQQGVNHSCGQPCQLMIPHVKLLIVCDEIKTDDPINVQLQQQTNLSGHPLYGLHILQVNLDRKPSMPPPSIRALRTSNSELTHISHLQDVMAEVNSIQLEQSQVYYSLPMIHIPTYHWSRGPHQWDTYLSPHQIEDHANSLKQKSLMVNIKTNNVNHPNLWPSLQEHERTYIRKLKQNLSIYKENHQESHWVFRVIMLFIWMTFMFLLHMVYKHFRRNTQSATSEEPRLLVPSMPFMHPKSYEDYPSINNKASPLFDIFRKNNTHTSIPVKKNPAINLQDPTTRPAPAIREDLKDSEPPSLHGMSHSLMNQESIDYPKIYSAPKSDVEIALSTEEEEVYISDTKIEQTEEGEDSSLSSFSELTVRPAGYTEDEIDEKKQREILAILYAERGPMKQYYFPVYDEVAKVGRSIECDCILPPMGKLCDSNISRVHFELLRQVGGSWIIRCLVTSGVYVNSNKLEINDTHGLQQNDIIRVGGSKFRFRYGSKVHL